LDVLLWLLIALMHGAICREHAQFILIVKI
jgi:hypothetical protein